MIRGVRGDAELDGAGMSVEGWEKMGPFVTRTCHRIASPPSAVARLRGPPQLVKQQSKQALAERALSNAGVETMRCG